MDMWTSHFHYFRRQVIQTAEGLGGDQFIGRVISNYQPVFYQNYPIAGMWQGIQVMSDKKRGQMALIMDAFDQFQYLSLGFPVQGCRRLIQQEDIGFLCQAAGDGDTLLLTTRQVPDGTFGQVCHAHHAEGFIGQQPVSPGRLAEKPQKSVTADHHHLAHRDRHALVYV